MLQRYLTNRRQTVRIQDFVSRELPVLSGVPQRSILGPMLFVIFTNDFLSCVMSDKYAYADDFKLIGIGRITIKVDLKKILKWCNNNRMAVNFAKTKYIQLRGTTSLKIENILVDSTPFMENLGLIVSENLTWSLHAK